jgi:putrescine aminotransferase
MIQQQDVKNRKLSQTEERYKRHVNPTLARLLKFSGYYAQESHADGVFVYDEGGERYIDCAGGYGVFVLGHRHPAVVQAVKDQLDQMPLSSKVFFNGVMAEAAEKLSGLTGGALPFSFFCNSGAEAVEGAVKIARMRTGRTEIISARNAFHGKTLGALSVSGRDIYKAPFLPLIPETVQVPFDDIAALGEVISDRTAAVILEPIQGEGGIVVPKDGYLAAARELTKKAGALLIADEIQSGMGRTGKFFAVEHWQVVPDMITVAKGLGGGVMPVGAILGTPEVWKVFQSNPLIHTSTFGGNQLACAAISATIDVIEKDGLLEKARRRGSYFLDGLNRVRKDYPEIISDVRGMGLMMGVELEKERYGGSIIFEMSRGRVTAVYTLNNQKVIRFEPPLIIEEEHIDAALEVFRAAVEKTKNTLCR